MPNSRYKMLPFKENVEVTNLIRKKIFAEVAMIISKNKTSIHKIVEKEKNYSSFAVVPQNAKILTTVGEKCLVRKEKTLHL
jgi:hypothetical protein